MEPITAAYTEHDADWTITVNGQGRELTARAPGIIAARDRADQLVEKLAPDNSGRTVVHLLNGSALDFTAAYIQARMSKPAAANAESPAPTSPGDGDKTAAAEAEEPQAADSAPEADGPDKESGEDEADAPTADEANTEQEPTPEPRFESPDSVADTSGNDESVAQTLAGTPEPEKAGSVRS